MSDLRDEDDFTHYFNATQRLSLENVELRAVVARVEALCQSSDPYAQVWVDDIRNALGGKT